MVPMAMVPRHAAAGSWHRGAPYISLNRPREHVSPARGGDGVPPTLRRAWNASENNDWISLTRCRSAVGEVLAWTAQPDCGATVTFFGTVRDHAGGRDGVVSLEYEAYGEYCEGRMARVADRGPPNADRVFRRLVLVHRVGVLRVGETAVMVAVVTAHREEAFSAARFCIDEVKATVPIWKFETWADGTSGGCRARLDGAAPRRPRCGATWRPEPASVVIGLADARRIVLDACSPLDVVPCPLARHSVASPPRPSWPMRRCLPSPTPRWTGFALVAADTLEAPVVLNVVATTTCGMAPASLGGGEAVRIMTGRRCPRVLTPSA